MDLWRGKWALVTGASAGIGVALAQQLAAGGANLVLTARRKDRLDELAKRLSDKYQIRTQTFAADLADAAAPEAIYAFTRSNAMEIDVLVNNAGFGQHGAVPDVDAQRLVNMVQVNCSAVVHLTRLYLPEMIARKRGYVLILASTAAFQAVPYISTYAATKAFDLMFAEGLAEEMKPHGISVCALCPGSTESEFFEAAGQQNVKFAKKTRETADKVARTGLKALAAGKSSVISGAQNFIGAEMIRFVPRRLVARIAANLFKPQK